MKPLNSGTYSDAMSFLLGQQRVAGQTTDSVEQVQLSAQVGRGRVQSKLQEFQVRHMFK
jgi:hypothetical protein